MQGYAVFPLHGAGDCPHCGGDVVFDLHGDAVAAGPEQRTLRSRLRKLARRLLGR